MAAVSEPSGVSQLGSGEVVDGDHDTVRSERSEGDRVMRGGGAPLMPVISPAVPVLIMGMCPLRMSWVAMTGNGMRDILGSPGGL